MGHPARVPDPRATARADGRRRHGRLTLTAGDCRAALHSGNWRSVKRLVSARLVKNAAPVAALVSQVATHPKRTTILKMNKTLKRAGIIAASIGAITSVGIASFAFFTAAGSVTTSGKTGTTQVVTARDGVISPALFPGTCSDVHFTLHNPSDQPLVAIRAITKVDFGTPDAVTNSYLHLPYIATEGVTGNQVLVDHGYDAMPIPANGDRQVTFPNAICLSPDAPGQRPGQGRDAEHGPGLQAGRGHRVHRFLIARLTQQPVPLRRGGLFASQDWDVLVQRDSGRDTRIWAGCLHHRLDPTAWPGGREAMDTTQTLAAVECAPWCREGGAATPMHSRLTTRRASAMSKRRRPTNEPHVRLAGASTELGDAGNVSPPGSTTRGAPPSRSARATSRSRACGSTRPSSCAQHLHGHGPRCTGLVVGLAFRSGRPHGSRQRRSAAGLPHAHPVDVHVC